MIALKIIRACFTKSFQHEFGDTWESVCEDMLHQARAKGAMATAKTWLGFVLDTAWRAPLMHMMAIKNSIRVPFTAPRPVLAGLGPAQASFVVAHHFVWQPTKMFWGWLTSYFIVLAAGIATAFATNAYLGHIVYREWRLAQENPDMYQNNDVIFLWQIICGVLVFAMSASALGGRKIWHFWKQEGFPVVLPMLTLIFSWTVTIFFLFMNELPVAAREFSPSFSVYPTYRDTPVADPNGLLVGQSPTNAQLEWYQKLPGVRVENYAKTQQEFQVWEVIPEKKQSWCATKMASLNSWQSQIKSSAPAIGNEVNTLLWIGLLHQAAQSDCMSVQELFLMHADMANWANSNVSFIEKKWRPLSFVMVVDNIVAGKYLIGQQLVPKPLRFCQTLATTKANKLGQDLNENSTGNFCITLEQRWTARQGSYESDFELPSYTFSQFLAPLLGDNFDIAPLLGLTNNVDYFEDHLKNAPSITEKDLGWIEQEIDQNWNDLIEKNQAEIKKQ